jgi:hypothetical protein
MKDDLCVFGEPGFWVASILALCADPVQRRRYLVRAAMTVCIFVDTSKQGR